MKTLRSSSGAGYSGRTIDRAALAWRCTSRHLPPQCSMVVKAQAAAGVRIDVEKTSWNSRRIFASVAVPAPKGSVWAALTDYDHLSDFIPSLVENRCLEREGNTALLYQVGAQDVALGVKFSAAVTLRCCEYPNGGLPEGLMTPAPPGIATAATAAANTSSMRSNGRSSSSSLGSDSEAAGSSESECEDRDGSSGSSSSGGIGEGSSCRSSRFPYPATTAPGIRPSDISFELVEGDFQTFRGVWRMQQTGEHSTLLSYALYVKPQSWLPVALIQGRIENEVVRNLEAVSRFAEAQFLKQQQQQQEEQPQQQLLQQGQL